MTSDLQSLSPHTYPKVVKDEYALVSLLMSSFVPPVAVRLSLISYIINCQLSSFLKSPFPTVFLPPYNFLIVCSTHCSSVVTLFPTVCYPAICSPTYLYVPQPSCPFLSLYLYSCSHLPVFPGDR